MSIFFTGSELVNIAIGIERNGAAFYNSLVESSKDDAVQRTYQHLADKEMEHLETFQKMFNSIGSHQLPETFTEEYDSYLKALVDSLIFSNDQVAREMALQVGSDDEAIQIALGVEKESILFYTEIRDLVRSSDRDTVNRIVQEEKSHVRELSEIKRNLGKQQ